MSGGFVIDFDIEGDVQAEASLGARWHRAENMVPVFEELATKFQKSEGRLFNTAGASGNRAWAPLKASTIRSKAARGLDPRILHATGALRASLTGSGSGEVKRVWPDGFEVGTSVAYARYHQHGTQRMVARRPAQLTPGQYIYWTRVIRRYLLDGIAAAGVTGEAL